MPEFVRFDSKGDLFVTNFAGVKNGHQIPGWVSEYAPKTEQLLAKISSGVETPGALAINPSETLLAVGDTHSNRILEYDTSDFKLVSTISEDVAHPMSLAFDSANNLYVVAAEYGKKGNGGLLVFQPGATKPSIRITYGIDNPGSVALDDAGNVYVSNATSCLLNGPCNHGWVSVYAAHSFKLVERILKGIKSAISLTLARG